MSRPVVIFANPIAGRGKAMAISEEIQKHLHKRFHIEHFSLPPQKVDLDRIIAMGPLHAAISLGGDGTLQGVSELLLKLTNNKPPPVMIVPLGTANLVAKHLKLPWGKSRDIDQIAAALEKPRIRSMDACRCNGLLFLAVAGVGMDAQVVHLLHGRRRGPITKGSYVMPAVEMIRSYRFPKISVQVDGRTIFAGAPALVYAGNVPEYGTGIPMLPHARSDDGLLDVCVLPCRNHEQALRWMMSAAAAAHPEAEGAIYLRGKTLIVEAGDDVPIQLDGEAAGHTPAIIEVIGTRLPFVVSR